MRRQNFTIVAVAIFVAAALLNYDRDNADKRERIFNRAIAVRESIESEESQLDKQQELQRQVDQLLETASRVEAAGEQVRRLHETAIRKKRELSEKRRELYDKLNRHIDEYNALADDFNRARRSILFWSTHRPTALDRHEKKPPPS